MDVEYIWRPRLTPSSGTHYVNFAAQSGAVQVGLSCFANTESDVVIRRYSDLRRMGHFECLRGNTQLKGPCPLHGPTREGSQSFSVNLRKNVFRCLNPVCAAEGNVLDLWAAHRNLRIYQAAIDLADTFHLDTTPNRGEATRNSEPATNRTIHNSSRRKKNGVITPDAN